MVYFEIGRIILVTKTIGGGGVMVFYKHKQTYISQLVENTKVDSYSWKYKDN